MELILEGVDETRCVQLKMECEEVVDDQNVPTCSTDLSETVIAGTLNTSDVPAVTVKTEPIVDINMPCEEGQTLTNTAHLITIFKAETI